MEIRSNYGLGHLEIAGWEIEGEPFSPSLRCDILAEAQGFQGKNAVHFDKPDLDRFLSDLEILDRTLKGEATLRSMSPDEFVPTSPLELPDSVSAGLRQGANQSRTIPGRLCDKAAQ